MTTSESINELAAALAKAQGAIEGAKKDSDNPFFRSKYADLSSVWDACRQALSANGLSVSQSPSLEMLGEPEVVTRQTRDGGDRDVVRGLAKLTVSTMLIHSSGQWLRDDMTCVLPTSDPQAVGSGTTYLRRYALAAFVGVAPEDDDAEATHGKATTQTTTAAPVGPTKLKEVKVEPTKNPNVTRYVATFMDGRKASTIKEELGTMLRTHAKMPVEDRPLIEAVIARGQYGMDLIELSLTPPPADQPF